MSCAKSPGVKYLHAISPYSWWMPYQTSSPFKSSAKSHMTCWFHHPMKFQTHIWINAEISWNIPLTYPRYPTNSWLYEVTSVISCISGNYMYNSIMWSYQVIKLYQVSHEFIGDFPHKSLLRHQIQHRLEPLVLHQAPEDLRVERRARLDVVAQGLGAMVIERIVLKQMGWTYQGLQHVTTCYNMLQHVTTCYNSVLLVLKFWVIVGV